jgi:uncharacterized membrane protein YagU involved in acid resistance
MLFRKQRRQALLTDVLGGLACGLIGSWVMSKAQAKVISRVGSARTKEREDAAASEPATVKAVKAITEPLGVSLDEDQLSKGGWIVHYAYGAAWGGLYAALSQRLKRAPLLFGAAFGALLWLVSDEVLVPAFGLAKKPTAYPPSVHLKSLATHVVYGAATAEAQRFLRARLDA